jgi:hypothetical protein
LHTTSWYFVTAYGRSISCPVYKPLKSELFRSADRCGGFSLEWILPVHSPDPIPNCQSANIEIIIAQIRAICTGNFDFFLPAASWRRSSRLAQAAVACLPPAIGLPGATPQAERQGESVLGSGMQSVFAYVEKSNNEISTKILIRNNTLHNLHRSNIGILDIWEFCDPYYQVVLLCISNNDSYTKRYCRFHRFLFQVKWVSFGARNRGICWTYMDYFEFPLSPNDTYQDNNQWVN